MVNALDVQSVGRWFKPGLCHHVISLDKKFYSTLSVFTLTQVYKMGTGDPNAGGNVVMDSHPIQRRGNIPSHFML